MVCGRARWDLYAPLAPRGVLAAWMAREARAGLAAGYAAGNLSSGQLVPVLLKAARSGSTWVGSILQEVSHRPFYLEARGPPAALQMELVLSGVGFSTNPVGTNATRHDWAAFGRAVVGRAALVVLHRANVVKHAVSFLRVPQAHTECGGVKSAGCMALQPSAINMWQLQEVLQCVYLHDHVLDTLFEQVTATGVPGLALTYEVNTALPDTCTRTRTPGLLRMHTVHPPCACTIQELQADPQRTSARLARLLRVPQSASRPSPKRRLGLVSSKAWPNDAPTKTGTDDVSRVLTNFEEVAVWLRNRSGCLEQQLRSKSHEAPTCTNPWFGEVHPPRCSDTMLGFAHRARGREGEHLPEDARSSATQRTSGVFPYE